MEQWKVWRRQGDIWGAVVRNSLPEELARERRLQ